MADATREMLAIHEPTLVADAGRALEFLEKVAGPLGRYLRFLPHRRESRAATRTWIGRVDLVEPGQ